MEYNPDLNQIVVNWNTFCMPHGPIYLSPRGVDPIAIDLKDTFSHSGGWMIKLSLFSFLRNFMSISIVVYVIANFFQLICNNERLQNRACAIYQSDNFLQWQMTFIFDSSQ